MAMTAEEQRRRALALLALQRQREAEAARAMSASPASQPPSPIAPGSGMVAGDIIGQMAAGGGTVPQPSPQVAQTAQSMAQLPEGVRNIPGNMAAFRQGVAEDIPILGPATTNAADYVGSQIAALLAGGDPNQIREQAVADFEASMEPYSVARGIGNVVGAVGPLAAASTTQLGGQLLGVTGSMPQRMLAGAASGGALGFGDTLARTGDVGEAALWGAGGAAAGAAFPLAERPAAAIMRMLTGQRTPPAVQTMARGLEREGIDPNQIIPQLDAIGPEAVPVDLGPNLMRQGGAIAALPGEGAATLRNFLGQRQAEANPRIQAQINSILGPAPVPSEVQAGIRANQQALSPQYQEAFRNARAVDTSELALHLDSQSVALRGDAQRAAQRVRQMLNVAGTDQLDPNPQTLFQTRQAIDDMLATETAPNAIRVLSDARAQVDDLLAQAVPGLKDVDARFAELARQGEALQTGQQLLDSGRTALRPSEVEALMQQQGTIIGPTGVPFRLTQGARAEIDRLIGTTANNINALKTALKGDGSWNRDRLVALFGKDRADQLLNVLEREVIYNRSFNTITQNSETAARQAAMSEVAPRQFDRSYSIADLLTRPVQALANMGARGRSEAVNAQIARLLTERPTPDLVTQLSAAMAQNRGVVPPSAMALLLTRGGE